MSEMPDNKPYISVVIPIFNENESLNQLIEEINYTLSSLNYRYEIIMVDDGSNDGSYENIEVLVKNDKNIHGVIMRGHFGKSEAFFAGFQVAKGDIVFTMDADLQDVPSEIPKFLDELEKGYDVVSGWKENRQDPLDKIIPSKIFNYVVSKVTGVKLHDHNCGFKVYRREVSKELSPYGELHRFMAVLAYARGYKIGEIPVIHRRRMYGKSKYGVGRYLNGLLDLITVTVTILYEKRPLHIFGKFGLVFFMGGMLGCVYLSILWLIGERPIGTRPLLTFSILMILFGIQWLSFGLLAEIIIRGQRRYKPRIKKVIK